MSCFVVVESEITFLFEEPLLHEESKNNPIKIALRCFITEGLSSITCYKFNATFHPAENYENKIVDFLFVYY